MFNNLKSSIQQAFFESLEQAGCLQLDTEGPEEDSDSGSEASDEESDGEDGGGADLGEDEEDGEDSDDEELPAEAPGPDSQRLLPPGGGGGSKLAPGEGAGFVEVNLGSLTSSDAATGFRDPALDAASNGGGREHGPRAGV